MAREIKMGLTIDTKKGRKSIDKVEESTKKFGKTAKKSAGKATKAFKKTDAVVKKLAKDIKGINFRNIAIGVTAAVASFAALTKVSLDAADSIAKTADKLGLATSALQELRFAAQLSGVATTAVDMGLQRFTRRLAEARQGMGELRGVLDQYSIATKKADGSSRSMEDVLNDLADVIKNTTDEQERLRIAFKAFDSEGVALVNMLKNGSVGLQEFRKAAIDAGLVIEERLLRQAEKTKDSLALLWGIIKTLSITFIAKLSPAIENIVNRLIEWYKRNREIIDQGMDKIIGLLTDKTIALATAFGTLKLDGDSLRLTFDKLNKVIDDNYTKLKFLGIALASIVAIASARSNPIIWVLSLGVMFAILAHSVREAYHELIKTVEIIKNLPKARVAPIVITKGVLPDIPKSEWDRMSKNAKDRHKADLFAQNIAAKQSLEVWRELQKDKLRLWQTEQQALAIQMGIQSSLAVETAEKEIEATEKASEAEKRAAEMAKEHWRQTQIDKLRLWKVEQDRLGQHIATKMQMEEDALREGLDNYRKYSEAWIVMNANMWGQVGFGVQQSIQEAETWGETWMRVGREVNDQIAGSFTDNLWSIIDRTKSAEQAAVDFGMSMTKWLFEIMVKQAMLNTLKQLWGTTATQASAMAAAGNAVETASVTSLTAAYYALAAAKMAAGASGGGGGVAAGAISGMAGGGDVGMGETVIVGEEGPELFTPKSSGNILSNNDLKALGGGQQPEINLNMANIVSPDLIDAYMASSKGKKAVLNVISTNRRSIKRRLM